MLPRSCRRIAGATLSLSLLILQPGVASAHHPMGGKLPSSFMDGLLSGLGHPILGPDHFAFVVGIGLLAAIGGFGLMLPALFVAAMVAGLGLHVVGADIPFAELLLAASVFAIGVAIALRRERPVPWLAAGLFALAGVLHGFAFAESVIGAEPTPILAYVCGLALMQLTIAAVAWQLARARPDARPLLKPVAISALGLTIAAVGAVFLALNAGIAA